MAGTKMIQSDNLSRRPDYIPDNDTDNENIMMLPDDLFIGLIDVDLQNQIAESDDMDKDAMEALATLLNQGNTTLVKNAKDWTTEKFNNKNILFFKGKNYIPRNDKLRRQIVELFHDHETAGHPGELETFNAVQQYYWWPELRTFVKNYVKGCGICQQFKIDRNLSKPTFLPVEGATST